MLLTSLRASLVVSPLAIVVWSVAAWGWVALLVAPFVLSFCVFLACLLPETAPRHRSLAPTSLAYGTRERRRDP